MTDEQFHKDCLYQLHILKLFPIPPDRVFEKKIAPMHFIGGFLINKQ
jgi:hypothetical protein